MFNTDEARNGDVRRSEFVDDVVQNPELRAGQGVFQPRQNFKFLLFLDEGVILHVTEPVSAALSELP